MEQLLWALSGRGEVDTPVGDLLRSLVGCVPPLDVYVCSFGGVGSTTLVNFLSQQGLTVNLLSDVDGYRHLHKPPKALPTAGTRVVYLYGNPLEAVCSHYRRGWAYHQASKTNPRLSGLVRHDLFPKTFVEYYTQGVDLFGLESHLRSWLNDPVDYDILFVKYENLFDFEVAQAMVKYLVLGKRSHHDLGQLARDFVALKRERQCQVPQEALTSMYVDMQQEILDLPPLFVRLSSGGRHVLVGFTADVGG